MESAILIILVVIFLGFLANRLNNTENAELEEVNPHFDEAVNTIYESAHESAEETNRKYHEDMNNEEKESNRECTKTENPDYESARQFAEEINKKYKNNMGKMAAKENTRELMFEILCQIGCQPKANDNGSLWVKYQGENFHMEFGGMYARIWDPMWARINADDPDLRKIRDAVNAANFNFGATVVMSDPNDEGDIALHSRRDIMIHPACPENTDYVKAVLDSFFDTKEAVRRNLHQLNS